MLPPIYNKLSFPSKWISSLIAFGGRLTYFSFILILCAQEMIYCVAPSGFCISVAPYFLSAVLVPSYRKPWCIPDLFKSIPEAFQLSWEDLWLFETWLCSPRAMLCNFVLSIPPSPLALSVWGPLNSKHTTKLSQNIRTKLGPQVWAISISEK